MNIRALRYFIETVKQGSFTAAAQQLGVTQSSVSKMVRQLEMDVGDTLIIREARQLQLSDSGRVLWERGRELLLHIEAIQEELRLTQSLQKGHLRLGIPPMINVLFTDVLKRFSTLYPDIQLHIKELPGPAIEEQMATNDLELGFSIYPLAAHLSLQHVPVVEHPIAAIATEQFLSAKRTSLSIPELAQLPLLLLTDDFGITRLLRRAFTQSGVNPTVLTQSSQWDWVLAMATSDLGVAVLPEPFLARLPNAHALKLCNINHPDLSWKVALLWQGNYLSLAAQAWLQCCEHVLGGKWLPDKLNDMA